MPRAGDELGGRWNVASVVRPADGAPVVELVAADGRRGRGVWLEGSPPELDPGPALNRAARLAIGCPGIPAPQAFRAEGTVVLWETRGVASLVTAVGGERVPSVRRLDAADVACFVREAARALAPLHDQGVSHGHLRGDLVVFEEGRLELGGYGIAALGAAGFAAEVERALPSRYRAPELEAAPSATPGADIFALGVIVRELLTGFPAQPGAPQAALGSVDARVEQLIARAMSEAPRERPPDVTRWAAELSEQLARPRGDSASVAGAGPTEPAHAPAVPEPSGATLDGEPALEQAELTDRSPILLEAPNPALAPPATGAPHREVPEAFRPLLDSAPPSALRGTRATAWLIAALTLGLLLMFAGVGLAFWLALRSPRPPVSAPLASAGPSGAAGSGSSEGAPAPSARASEPNAQDDGADAGEPAEDNASADAAPDASVPSPGTASERAATPAAHYRALVPLAAETPTFGDPRALVTVVVFGDLDSPETRRSLRELRAAGRADRSLRVAWRHRPLPAHADAKTAALVGAALGATRGDDAFWRLLDQIAASSEGSTEANLETWLDRAGEKGFSVPSAVTSAEAARRVEADLTQAAIFGVRGVPTLFVNGKRIDEPLEATSLARLIDEERRRAAELVAGGMAIEDVYARRVLRNLIGAGPQPKLRRCPGLDDAPSRGRTDALVTIVEFGDFECPHCRRAAPELAALATEPDLRVVWKTFPLAHHPTAKLRAGYAFEALERGGPGAFWRVHDLLFTLADPIDEPALAKIAEQAGVPAGELTSAAERGEHAQRLSADAAEAKRLGVNGTPTLFVNGRRVAGFGGAAELRAAVGEELVAARRLMANGVARGEVYVTLCGADDRDR